MRNLHFANLENPEPIIRPIVCDCAIVALGYESRAREIPALIRDDAERFAIGFDHNHVLDYEDNLRFLRKNGYHVAEDVSDLAFQAEIASIAARTASSSARARSRLISFAVDVSCFSRFRLAAILAELLPLVEAGVASLQLWYAVAEFVPPPDKPSRNETVCPVHPRFTGWFRDPARPVTVVAGLGYEEEKVLGAAEYLQAQQVFAFFPLSPIGLYEHHVEAANALLLSEYQFGRFDYNLANPKATLSSLDSAVRGLSERTNVVLLPLGPKLFVTLSLIAQALNPTSSVWRVSSGSQIEPRPIASSGTVIGMAIDPYRHS